MADISNPYTDFADKALRAMSDATAVLKSWPDLRDALSDESIDIGPSLKQLKQMMELVRAHDAQKGGTNWVSDTSMRMANSTLRTACGRLLLQIMGALEQTKQQNQLRDADSLDELDTAIGIFEKTLEQAPPSPPREHPNNPDDKRGLS